MSPSDPLSNRHVFLIGNPLSGTSMLYRLMAYHPDLAWFSQWSLRNGAVSHRRKVPLAYLLDKYGRNIAPHPWSKVTHMKGLNWFFYRIIPSPADGGNIWDWVFPGLRQNMPYERDKKIASGELPVNDHGTDTDKEIHDRLYYVINNIITLQAKQRFLGKRPILAYVAPIIGQLCKNAQFVHIVRDPRAFCLSSLQKGPVNDVFPDLSDAVKMFATYWKNTIIYMEELEHLFGPERLITFRYEDFIKDVHGYLNKIYIFAGLDTNKINITHLPKYIPDTNKKYFIKPNQHYIDIINEIAATTARKYGYH